MAEYFLGLWGGGNPKPFEYSDLQRQRFHLADTKGEEDRKVGRTSSNVFFGVCVGLLCMCVAVPFWVVLEVGIFFFLSLYLSLSVSLSHSLSLSL